MYKIKKIINNNIVSSSDIDGNEVIIRGLGIGFQKKKNDLIPDDKIEKIYSDLNEKVCNKFQKLLSEIPDEYEKVCSDIIDNIKNNLNLKISDNIYISLTDHISFAIKRMHEGLNYKNPLLWEIKKFYPKEYDLGLKSIAIIKERLNEKLPEDEAGFIALHIVNAEFGTKMDKTVIITEMIHKILQIVKYYYQIEFDENSLYYERFMTHLKFFCNRIINNSECSNSDDDELNSIIKEKYKTDYKCAEKIKAFMKKEYDKEMTNDEMTFITIHLKRISQAT